MLAFGSLLRAVSLLFALLRAVMWLIAWLARRQDAATERAERAARAAALARKTQAPPQSDEDWY